MSGRRRAVLLGAAALALGGLAAFNVAGREAALQQRIGALVDIVVAREPIAAGTPLRARALAIRRVPRRFAPAGAISSPQSLIGLRATVEIARGSDLTASLVVDGQAQVAGPRLRRGERVAEVVALGSPEHVTAGSHVDVLVTPEPGSGSGAEAVLALQDVEVLGAVPAPAEGAPGGRPVGGTRVAASLRVTLRQALYLAAAQDFARELRLLPRSDGDRGRGREGLRVGAAPR